MKRIQPQVARLIHQLHRLRCEQEPDGADLDRAAGVQGMQLARLKQLVVQPCAVARSEILDDVLLAAPNPSDPGMVARYGRIAELQVVLWAAPNRQLGPVAQVDLVQARTGRFHPDHRRMERRSLGLSRFAQGGHLTSRWMQDFERRQRRQWRCRGCSFRGLLGMLRRRSFCYTRCQGLDPVHQGDILADP